jgi:transposase
VHLNLAYRWFCRLDLTNRIPDHSTFSKNRHGRFRESDLLRHVFEATVARCREEGLVHTISTSLCLSLLRYQQTTLSTAWRRIKAMGALSENKNRLAPAPSYAI